jgi:hypothetical protein
MTGVYVLCPIAVTGGPELLHQLVDVLNTRQPDSASIVYHPGGETPEPYRRYLVRPAVKDEIQPGDTIVLPEIFSGLVGDFPGARVLFWWLSVDNFHAWSGDSHMALLRQHVSAHLYQSEYARAFLERKGLCPALRLSDRLAGPYIDAIGCPPTDQRGNLVAYNPAKGGDRARRVLAELANTTRVWVIEIADMSPGRVRAVLASAKVYIDFGHHPGKDRLPREAAAMGCCVVTNRRGSAANDIDVPIPQQFKIDDHEPGWEHRAVTTVRNLLADFDRQRGLFDDYRAAILAEHDQFEMDAAAVFPPEQDWSLGPELDGARDFPVLRHVVENLRPDGWALEFGVAEGRSLSIIAAAMPAIGFDSFQGLPEPWGPYEAGWRACAPPVIPGAELVVGWFDDTLPKFDFATVEPIGLVHFDADLYSSTATILRYLGPHLRPGCYLVFDEWHGQPWHDNHENRAWREYAQATGACWTVIGHHSEGWAIRLSEPSR